ncbi:MAG: autotransporter assembly complex protein TamA [Gammaproteobacteria bacterium]
MTLMRNLLATLLILLATATASAEVTLRIEGIEDELLANVKAWIGPAEETDRMTFRALEQHATEKSRLALQALGYYDPVISTERETAGSRITCLLLINAGEPVRITRIDIRLSGEGHRELDELIAASAPRVGNVFHHGAYDSFRDSFLRSALMLGYFDARYTQQEVRVDPASHSAEVTLALATGARHRIGDITIEGEGLNLELVSRFPRFRTGDWYNAMQIAELHRDLVRAGWFESVRIIADPDPVQPLTVPVVIRYTLRQRNRVGLGAGFSTDVGPRVKVQWEKPRLNRRGHSMGAYAELSEVRSQFEASYVVPLKDPVTSQLAFTYGLQLEELQDFDFWRTTAGIEHRKRLANRWRLTRAVQVERETDDFGAREESTTLVVPGITLSRTDSEGALLVTRGWRATGKIQAASRDLLSDAEMLRFTLNAKAIHGFGSRTRGILRGAVGAMATPDIQDIPLSLRFFTGGDQSVRGYDYRSIGPVDDQGLVIGGRYNLEGSVEMDYRFADRWLVALFADSGSAFDKEQSPDFFDGVGAGIRWLSPIGPLRLDFAYGVSLPDPSFNIHFYMGPEL